MLESLPFSIKINPLVLFVVLRVLIYLFVFGLWLCENCSLGIQYSGHACRSVSVLSKRSDVRWICASLWQFHTLGSTACSI